MLSDKGLRAFKWEEKRSVTFHNLSPYGSGMSLTLKKHTDCRNPVLNLFWQETPDFI